MSPTGPAGGVTKVGATMTAGLGRRAALLLIQRVRLPTAVREGGGRQYLAVRVGDHHWRAISSPCVPEGEIAPRPHDLGVAGRARARLGGARSGVSAARARGA